MFNLGISTKLVRYPLVFIAGSVVQPSENARAPRNFTNAIFAFVSPILETTLSDWTDAPLSRSGRAWQHSRQRSWPSPPRYTLPESPPESGASAGRSILDGDSLNPI